MPMADRLPAATTLEVKDRCLCLHLQRAARLVARRFDEAFRPFGLTNGQFSLMMALNRPEPPRMRDVAPFLAMDRTTLTAALKPLERRGLVSVFADNKDKRVKRLGLTAAGRHLLADAVPVWRRTHDDLDDLFEAGGPERLRGDLRKVG